MVVHYGVPSDLDDYIQQTSRAGREAIHQAHAVILKYKRCLAGKNIKQSMKSFTNSKAECRRVLLYNEYMKDITPVKPAHKCCDLCASNCDCSPDCDRLLPKLIVDNQEDLGSESDSEPDDSSDHEGIEHLSSDEEVARHRASKPTAILCSSDSDSN